MNIFKVQIFDRINEKIYKLYYLIIYLSEAAMNKISVDDFHFNSVIGKGTYAKVCLVTRKKDEKLFALKMLKKKFIIEKGQ